MAKLEIREKSGQLYAVRRLERQETTSAVELDILGKGEIEGLAMPQLQSRLTRLELWCPILERTTLADLFAHGVSFFQFRHLVQQVLQVIQGCESRGIHVGNLELNAKSIFCNLSSGYFQMLYWPLLSMGQSADLRTAFFEYGMQYRCTEEDYVMRDAYLSFFQDRTRFDSRRFAEFLSAMTEGNKVRKPLVSGTLSGLSPALYDLTRKQKVAISRFPFVVGRDGDRAHYLIGNDAEVSRTHFVIYLQGDRFSILDKSSNGTFLNGARLPSGTVTQLQPGDRIRAGRWEFLFTLS